MLPGIIKGINLAKVLCLLSQDAHIPKAWGQVLYLLSKDVHVYQRHGVKFFIFYPKMFVYQRHGVNFGMARAILSVPMSWHVILLYPKWRDGTEIQVEPM